MGENGCHTGTNVQSFRTLKGINVKIRIELLKMSAFITCSATKCGISNLFSPLGTMLYLKIP